MSEITSENYVFKFGKYINMRAVDVAALKTIDKDIPIGCQPSLCATFNLLFKMPACVGDSLRINKY